MISWISCNGETAHRAEVFWLVEWHARIKPKYLRHQRAACGLMQKQR